MKNIKRELCLLGAALSAMIGLAILLGILAATGCATKPGDTPIDVQACETWRRAVDYYDALIATGAWIPSEDEKRAEAAARLLMAVACGTSKAVHADNMRGIAYPKQLDKFVFKGAKYELRVPFSIIQDPTGVFSLKRGLETRTIGPLYGVEGDLSGCLWMTPLAYERGLVDEIEYLHPIACQ